MPGDLRLGTLSPDLYFPLVFAWVGVGNWSFPGVARLRPGVTVEQANADLDRMTVSEARCHLEAGQFR